ADGLPSLHQTCVDGDPSCDADGAADGRCSFRVAVCLLSPDPDLPSCTVPLAIEKFEIESPRASSIDPEEQANMLALMDAFGRLSPVVPDKNRLFFDPPMALLPPDNCTD